MAIALMTYDRRGRAFSLSTIALTTERGYFEYLVESITVVPPSDTSVIQPTSRQTLTLITCFPFSYIGPAPDRFVVRARYIAAARDDAVR